MTILTICLQNFHMICILEHRMDGIRLQKRLRKKRRVRQRVTLASINRVNLRQIRDASDPFNVTEEVFLGIFRLSKVLAMNLIDELRPHMAAGERSTAIPHKIKVLCALHFYGQGSYQKAVGSDMNLSLSQASVSRALEEVTNALNAEGVLEKWVAFPLTQHERMQVIAKNYQATGMHGVLGYVDGTHIPIKAPNSEEKLFINTKSYHSINVQIVCDSDIRILNVLARFPGGTHDSLVWGSSAVFHVLGELWQNGEQCWLLGDSGYHHQPWLQTPILNALHGSPEARYTDIHIRAHSAIERCIGVLKRRFNCLSKCRVIGYSPTKVCRIINACCVLHNMCVQAQIPPPPDAEQDIAPQEQETAPQPVVPLAGQILQEACEVRRSIVSCLQ